MCFRFLALFEDQIVIRQSTISILAATKEATNAITDGLSLDVISEDFKKFQHSTKKCSTQ